MGSSVPLGDNGESNWEIALFRSRVRAVWLPGWIRSQELWAAFHFSLLKPRASLLPCAKGGFPCFLLQSNWAECEHEVKSG